MTGHLKLYLGRAKKDYFELSANRMTRLAAGNLAYHYF